MGGSRTAWASPSLSSCAGVCTQPLPIISATSYARRRRPEPIKDWSLTSLEEKLIKIGAKVVSHSRYIAFQMAEVAIPRTLFANILRLIAELWPPPIASTA